MFYVYTIVAPLAIVGLGYLFRGIKPKSFVGVIDLIATLLPYLFCYAFFTYFLEMENLINEGWVFYSLIFFLMPIAGITLLIKLINWIRKPTSTV